MLGREVFKPKMRETMGVQVDQKDQEALLEEVVAVVLVVAVVEAAGEEDQVGKSVA